MAEYLIFDLRDRPSDALPRVHQLSAALMEPRNEKYAVEKIRSAVAKLDKLNVPTLRNMIMIRDDGKFVPVVLLEPIEDDYHQSIMDRGVLALKGN